MHKFSENLLQTAIALSDTVEFEYEIESDEISFADNIKDYIPMPAKLPNFVERMDSLGKIYERDIEKAITFFSYVGQEDKVKMEYVRFLDFSGSYRWFQLKGVVRNTDNGGAKLHGTLSRLSSDSNQIVNNILDKDTFIEKVNEYIKEAPDDVIPNLMIIDPDNFIDFRAIHGEINGDGVFLEIGRILKRTLRETDLIGKLDIDQFAVFMKDVSSNNIILERAAYIRKSVKEVWSDFDNDRALTVSIGVALMDRKEADYMGLLTRSTSALLDAKSLGKDGFVLYTKENERLDSASHPYLSSKEMKIIKDILDPMCAWAYAVDEDYNLVYRNELLNERVRNANDVKCYAQLKGYSEPCPDCPLKSMGDKDSIYDCDVYSPGLRSIVPARANKITLGDGKIVYILASVKQNAKTQYKTMLESEERMQKSLYEMQDVIWDVNITKNLCVRIKEKNIRNVIDAPIENYEKLRTHYSDYVVCREDLIAFYECTDPKYIKQALNSGQTYIRRDVRLKSLSDDYVWYGINTMIINPEVESLSDEIGSEKEDLRVMIVCSNNDYFKRRSIEDERTKLRFKIMNEKSEILREMSLNYERYENVNHMIGLLVYEYDVPTKECYLCSNFEDVFDINVNDLTDEWAILECLKCHPDDLEIFEKFKHELKESRMVQKTTVRLYNRFNVPVWYTIYVQVLKGINNEPVRFLGTLQNVNTEMRIKAEMEYRADFDSVTGLYNAETFYRKAGELLHLFPDKKYAIISIDIDRFRLINDRYGIDAGNATLKALGSIIKKNSPKDSIAKRYQSDVFTVIFSYEGEQELIDYMTTISSKSREIDVLPMPITLTYGIYKVNDKDIPARLMCDRARAVKKQVKSTAFTNYGVYDDVIRLKLREQAEIEEEMEHALINKEFVMFLQPQIDIKSGRIVGAEALVRWKHPLKGIMVPGQFLGLFESNGFITRMDAYIWEEACKYLRYLQNKGIMIPISVNISRIHVGKTDLSSVLLELINKYNIEPKYLELEITENLFMDDVKELFDEMSILKENGFKILMDDFGSGYSSLNMLRNAPVDTLKIDRFFLDEIMSTERGRIIVESSVRMAKQLGMSVIAEGVETKDQLEFLRSIECDIAQGYYFSRPISTDDYEVFMNNNLAEHSEINN